MSILCQCENYKSYKEYKEEAEQLGYFVSLDIKDEDCIECYFTNLLGEHDIKDRTELLSKRVKARYNTKCSCGHYYPYSKLLEKRRLENKLVSPMMPLTDCYNCYLMKRYGTLDRKSIGEQKKSHMLRQIEVVRSLIEK